MKEVYAARKENEIVTFAGNRVKLEIKILSKIRQTQKDKYHIYANLSLNYTYVYIRYLYM